MLDSFVSDHGVVINELSDEILTELGNVTGEVISELISADPMSAKVFKSMSQFRTSQIRYTTTSDSAFVRARNLPYKFPTG